MDGIAIDDLRSPSNGVRTLVLVGRTGNGKSATGNSILGKLAFKFKTSSSGVTSSCKMQRTVHRDGQVINVIDTPGLSYHPAGSEFVGKEIVKCMDLAKDGIHAFLLVLSVRNRFSQEEEDALHSLQSLFGSRIIDYMIVVFTGGDELEDNEETLEDYLGRECPESFKNILQLCKNRIVLFDNKTKNKAKRSEQVGKLLSLVNTVIEQNGGQPYTDDIFAELKKGAPKLGDQQVEVDSLNGYSKQEISELKEQMHRSYEEQLKRIAEMFEAQYKGKITSLEEQLEQTTQKSNNEIHELIGNLERAQKEMKEMCNRLENRKPPETGKPTETGKPLEKWWCTIL